MRTETTTATAPAATPGPGGARRRGPATAVLIAEIRLFLREPGSLFWVFVFPSLLLVILGFVPAFRETRDDLGGRRVIDLYVPISILLAMITAGIQAMPPVLTAYRERGILRRIVEITPFGAASQALEQAASGSWPGWIHLGTVALWTVATGVAASRMFRWQ
ncbi:hypothetical protein [Streptomyces cyaneofuscatus]|uniref:hypothetical protein n=1 Tax=Streptomyces cyaneofuscatus TaxID=66883 RepID=UPI0033A67A1E